MPNSTPKNYQKLWDSWWKSKLEEAQKHAKFNTPKLPKILRQLMEIKTWRSKTCQILHPKTCQISAIVDGNQNLKIKNMPNSTPKNLPNFCNSWWKSKLEAQKHAKCNTPKLPKILRQWWKSKLEDQKHAKFNTQKLAKFLAIVDGNQNLKAQEHAKKFNTQKLPKIRRQLMEIETWRSSKKLPNSTPENCQNSAIVDGNQNLKLKNMSKFNKHLKLQNLEWNKPWSHGDFAASMALVFSLVCFGKVWSFHWLNNWAKIDLPSSPSSSHYYQILFHHLGTRIELFDIQTSFILLWPASLFSSACRW